MRLIISFILVLCLNHGAAQSSTTEHKLLKDINKLPSGSNPQHFVTHEENVFFFAKSTIASNFDLWVHNTTTEENHVVLENNIIGNNIPYLKKGKRIFVRDVHFDSTVVIDLKTLVITKHKLNYNNLSESNGRIFYYENAPEKKVSYLDFVGNAPVLNLIYSFKNDENTYRKTDFEFDGQYTYFAIHDINSINGYRFYKCDGQNLSPEPFFVSDWERDNINSLNNQLYWFNGLLLFWAVDSPLKSDLWVTDGTPEGTKSLLSFSLNGYSKPINNITLHGNNVFFNFDGYLSQTDGTISGSRIIVSYVPKVTDYKYLSKSRLPILGNSIFYANRDDNHGVEPRVYDYVTGNNSLLKDIITGPENSSPKYFHIINSKLYFIANDLELWESDGTSLNTNKVTDLTQDYVNALYPSAEAGIFHMQSGQFFYMGLNDTGDIEPWVLDPLNPITAHELININKNEKGSVVLYDGYSKFELNDKVFFIANDGIHGSELWVSDMTEANTSLFKDLTPGLSGTNFMDAIANDTICYFIAYSNNQYGIWKTDGTVNGTTKFWDYTPSGGLNKGNLFLSEDKLFFLEQTRLYSTDGTAEGTIQLSPGPQTFEEIKLSSNRLLYRNGLREIWISDGSLEGTEKLPNLDYNLFQSIGFIEGQVITEYENSDFTDDRFVKNLHLVKLIGTENNYEWEEIASHEGYSFVTNYNLSLDPWNNSLFYWSNIVQENTSIKLDLNLTKGEIGDSKFIKTIELNNLEEITALNTSNLFYFVCKKYSNRNELWRSDGTTNGTFKLLDFTGFNLFSFQEHNRKLYFSANHEDYGSELWETDGTVAGTKIRVDHLTGSPDSFITNLLVKDDVILFSAFDTLTGWEFYTMPLGCDGEVYSIQSGNWHDTASWSCGELPNSMDNVTIKSGHKIIHRGENQTSFKSLTTEVGAVLNIESESVFKSDGKTY